MSYRVLVTGSRGCADLMADAWAARRGVPVEGHPANWQAWGKRAGFMRNEDMVATRPDACLAFIKDNSRGATHCATAAQAAGIATVLPARLHCGRANRR